MILCGLYLAIACQCLLLTKEVFSGYRPRISVVIDKITIIMLLMFIKSCV